MYMVSIEEIKRQFNLTLLNEEISLKGRFVRKTNINRPALQLAGFFEHFDSDRVQILGMVEYAYLERKSKTYRREIMDKLFSYQIPCLVICRNLPCFEETIECANQYNVPVLQTEDNTTDFEGELIRWLKVELAPRVTIHGVLVDVYGEGLFIMGESGVGKSEMALELIKRGHRLVADDAVEIKKVSNQTLIGTSPDVIRHFIELRGIGIIDVSRMFGVESVKQTQNIDLIIKLEDWDSDKQYDRLGLTEEYVEILGNKVICHNIPIRPGRNLAVICESAAVNHRQKKMGYNAAKVLNDRVMNTMSKSPGK